MRGKGNKANWVDRSAQRNHPQNGGGRRLEHLQSVILAPDGGGNDESDAASIIAVILVPPHLTGASLAVSEWTTQAKAIANATAIHKVRPNTDWYPLCLRNQYPSTRHSTSLPARSQRS